MKILKHPGVYPFIGFSPTGELLASAGSGKLVLWDVFFGLEINTLKTYHNQFAFSSNGQQLAAISYKKEDRHQTEIKVWDIRSPKKIKVIATLPFDEAHKTTGIACAVNISPDGKFIAAGYSNGTINVWDFQTRQLLKTLETSKHHMDYIIFSPNSKYMVTGGHALDFYSTHSVKGFIMWELPSWNRKGEVLRGDVESIEFSPDEKICVTTAGYSFLYGRGVEIWSTTNGAPITSLQTGARETSFSKDGNMLVSANNNGDVQLWELTSLPSDLEAISNDMVRLIYFRPKGKEIYPNITQKIDKTIKEVQKFYADEMERFGFGRKTFSFETDENGKAKIYLMEESQFQVHDLQLNDIWLVFVDDINDVTSAIVDKIINRNHSVTTGDRNNHYDQTFTFPTKRRTFVKGKIWMDDVKGFTGKGRFISTKKNLDWRVTVDELKYLFAGLDWWEHRLDEYKPNAFKKFFKGINRKMPWGKGWVELSKCEAEWLDKSRFFNPSQPFFDKRPEIEMEVLNADKRSQFFQFKAADEDGIHQLQLFIAKDVEKVFPEKTFHGWQALNGKKKATVEFEISDPNIKRGEIRMMDMFGNIASREFRITQKTSETDKE